MTSSAQKTSRDWLAWFEAPDERSAALSCVTDVPNHDEPSLKRRKKEEGGACVDIDRGFLPDLIGYHIGRVRTAMWRHRLAGDTNLKRSGHFTALALIAFNPGVSQQQIADELLLDKATVVGVIDRLEKEGLIERQRPKRDRRRHALHATSFGHKRLAQTHRRLVDHEVKLRAEFSSVELASLFAYLDRLVAGCAPDHPAAASARTAVNSGRSPRSARQRSLARSDDA